MGAAESSAAPCTTLVRARGVRINRAGRTVLRVSDLHVRRGELVSFIGPNGAGKSTLAAVLGALERPREGEVWFDGVRVDWSRNALAVRRRIAMVLQEPLLFDTSVFENVATGLRFRNISGSEVRGRVDDWLDRLRIAHLARRSARTLSGGEAQRTSLARALVLDPELLLLDEPFGALDPPTREDLLMELLPLLRERGRTTVLITHDHDEAFALSDRVGVILDGEIAELDTPMVLTQRTLRPEVARFIRARGYRGHVDRNAEMGEGAPR